MTNKRKGYPFEVALPKGAVVSGVILADQVRNLDWRARKARLIGRIADPVLADVTAKTTALIDPNDE